MTPLPKGGFGSPLVWYVFHPPQVSVLCFSCTTEQTRSSFGGVQNFRESAFSGTFSSPHTFCTPPYHGPISGCGSQNIFYAVLICEKSWSKRKRAFGHQGAMMDAHTVPLIACAGRLLCDMPSAKARKKHKNKNLRQICQNPSPNLLGWHLCRAKLAQFFELRTFLRKML